MHPRAISEAPQRVIGRILSLGFPMPGPQVDNYNFVSAPSFFDYDAIVVDPSQLSSLIEGVIGGALEARTFGDRVVANAPEGPTQADLAGVLLRRRQETQLALDRGCIVICFAHPPAVHRGIEGTDELDDYYWLPPPQRTTLACPYLLPADGTTAHVVDHQHPLAAFVVSQLANIAYRARFAIEPIADLPDCGRVFVTSEGGAPIGVDLPAASSRVIFLPALKSIPSGDARYAMSDTLQASIRRALGAIAPGAPPPWLAAHPLPGLADRVARLDSARGEFDNARRVLHEAEAVHEQITRYQRLLWQEGSIGLDGAVLDALRLIGCDVYDRSPHERELRAEGVRALVDIEGRERPIDMAPHYRLRQRIERVLESGGDLPRAVLFVNGCRLQRPENRTDEISPSLRLAAETMRYCIAPTSSLYRAVAAKFAGDDDAVAEYRRRLVTQDGLLA